MKDTDLLAHYLREGDEAAFSQLVRIHERMVIGAAWRQTGDPELARDVAQQVFATLARKAALLTGRCSLAGWLHIAATHFATRARGAEAARQRRHEAAAQGKGAERNEDTGRLIEEALSSLPAREREALILHYFEDRSYAEMAAALGLQEAAARKRVSRSLERLGAELRRRGFTGRATTALLAAAAAQSHLPFTVSAVAALAAPAAGSSFALTLTTLMGNTALKIAAAIVLVSTLPIAWQSHANSALRDELADARRAAAAKASASKSAADDTAHLRAELAALSTRLAGARLRKDETANQLAESQRELERIQQEVLVKFGKTEDLARTFAAKLKEMAPVFHDLEKREPLDAAGKERMERAMRTAMELLTYFGHLRQLDSEPEQAGRFGGMVIAEILELPPENAAALERVITDGYANLRRAGLSLSDRPKENVEAWADRRNAADKALCARILAIVPEHARSHPAMKFIADEGGILLPPEAAALGGVGGLESFLKANPLKRAAGDRPKGL